MLLETVKLRSSTSAEHHVGRSEVLIGFRLKSHFLTFQNKRLMVQPVQPNGTFIVKALLCTKQRRGDELITDL